MIYDVISIFFLSLLTSIGFDNFEEKNLIESIISLPALKSIANIA
jgi:hypothetical protein